MHAKNDKTGKPNFCQIIDSSPAPVHTARESPSLMSKPGRAVRRQRPPLPLRIFLVLVCCVLACSSAKAVDPDRRISQYAHTAWRVRDGAFTGAPSSITQTTDGYMWIGTESGLVRFDGVRFESWPPPSAKHLPSPGVISLLGAKDGSLWIGTDSGLAQWKNGDLINFPETLGRVNSIYEDRAGTIWMTRSRTRAGGVCQVAASVVKCYGPNDGVPPYAETLVGDNSGYLWIGSSSRLVRWKPGSFTSYSLPGLKSQAGLSGVNALAIAGDGSVWTGISDSGRGLGLQRWVNGGWKTLLTPAFDGSTLNVYGLRLDRHNALWVASEGTGIYRIYEGKVDHFSSTEGLSSDSAETFFEDREGNLWVTTREGVDCFRDIPVVNFSTHEGLSADRVESVIATRDGTIWFGNSAGLDYARGGIVSSIRQENGLPGKRVTSLFEDHAGRLWVGLDNGLFVYQHGRFRPIQRPDGGSIGIVMGMIEEADGDIWAEVIKNDADRLVQIRDGKFVAEMSDPRLTVRASLAADPQGGFWLGFRKGSLGHYRSGNLQVFPLQQAKTLVFQIMANPDGSVLAATSDGLVEQRDGIQYILNHQNGLPCDRIYGMVTDNHSNLWLYAECGLISIQSDGMHQWREHPDARVTVDLLDAYEGVQPYLAAFRPIATRSSDGRLWFANEAVAQMLDPDQLFRNPILPPVHIEEVIADRKTYSPRNDLRLPALTRDLEIDYTALSFVLPQKVRFRYKLEGYDRDWQDPQNRRQAFYSSLRPGNYRFRVIASNNSGAWNEAGAALDFNIAPAYYQTYWFLAVCVASALAALYLFYFLRLRQAATRVRLGMEARLAERESIARDLHDTLLQSVQGLILKFHALARRVPDRDPVRQDMEKILDSADQVLGEGRDRVRTLRSATHSFGELPAAFQRVVEEFSPDRTAILNTMVGGGVRELHPMIREESFLIGREAIINALQHSEGRNLEVEIIYDLREFRLRIRDDGRGIDPEILEDGGRAGHWGLQGMRERANRIGAQLELWSGPGSGTEIELRIPGATAYLSIDGRADSQSHAGVARSS